MENENNDDYYFYSDDGDLPLLLLLAAPATSNINSSSFLLLLFLQEGIPKHETYFHWKLNLRLLMVPITNNRGTNNSILKFSVISKYTLQIKIDDAAVVAVLGFGPGSRIQVPEK